jgi:hypothetical protein
MPDAGSQPDLHSILGFSWNHITIYHAASLRLASTDQGGEKISGASEILPAH